MYASVAWICLKIWGEGSRSVRSSHQTVSDYTLRQWFPNTQQCRFLTTCRRLERLVLSSIFDTSLSSLMMWNLQSCPTAVFNERMWHLRGSKHTLTHLTYFPGVKTPTPGFTPLVTTGRYSAIGGHLSLWITSDMKKIVSSESKTKAATIKTKAFPGKCLTTRNAWLVMSCARKNQCQKY